MKRMIFGLGLFSLLTVFTLASIPAFAADRQNVQFGESGKGPSLVFGTSDMMDKTVKDQQGDDLGRISDVIFTQEGRISYLIVGTGGILGLGEKYLPVPFKSVQWDPQQDTLVLPFVNKESLKSAPTIKKNDWAQFEDPRFGEKVNAYYTDLQSAPRVEQAPLGQQPGQTPK